MPESITFYFSIPSRYSYLASTQMDALSRDTGCEVVWTPVDANELRRKANSDPFSGPVQSGQYRSPYREQDLANWVDFYGVPYREPPDDGGDLWWKGFGWEKMRVIALAALAGQELGGGDQWFKAMFQLMFVSPDWPFDVPEIFAVARSTEVDPQALAARMDDVATSDRLSANTDRAIAAGVFGVPSFVYGDQMFFGNDRLMLLRHNIATRR